MKKLTIWVDDGCVFCKDSIKKIENHSFKKNERLTLSPDFNAHNVITHFHLWVSDNKVVKK